MSQTNEKSDSSGRNQREQLARHILDVIGKERLGKILSDAKQRGVRAHVGITYPEFPEGIDIALVMAAGLDGRTGAGRNVYVLSGREGFDFNSDHRYHSTIDLEKVIEAAEMVKQSRGASR